MSRVSFKLLCSRANTGRDCVRNRVKPGGFVMPHQCPPAGVGQVRQRSQVYQGQAQLWPPASVRRAQGFTLLETLMVLLVGGMLLLAAASFLFGAMTLRRQIDEAPQLGQHAASTVRVLETVFGSAESQQGATGSAAAGGAGGSASLINWQQLPSAIAGSEQALYLRVRGGLPMFVGRGGLTDSAVSCYLLFEKNRGLLLLWQSERMRLEDENDWEQTVLSPLVSAANLLFYDAQREQWERTDDLRQPFATTDSLPQMLQLTFKEPGSSREIVAEVLLPPPSAQLFGL